MELPPPQGLKVVLDVHGKPRHSVRGIVIHLKAPSGFAIGPDGDICVAERFNQRVRRFSVKGKCKSKGTLTEGLPDMPEFLVHMADRT